jgi:hypothetical protein
MQRVESDSDVIIHIAKLNKLKAGEFRIHPDIILKDVL